MKTRSVEDLSGVAQILQAELQRRFVKYTSPSSEKHNAVMLPATTLDGRYRVLLNPIQVDSAQTMFMELVSVHRHIDIIMCVQIMPAWHSIVASELTLTQIPSL